MPRRVGVTLVVAATLAVLFVQGAWALNDRRRAEGTAARESYLYSQLANRDGVLESQRRIYIERLRKVEAQLRERDRDVAALRARLRLETNDGKPGS